MNLTPLGYVQLLLILGAFALAVAAAMGKAPLWTAVVLLTLALLLVILLGR